MASELRKQLEEIAKSNQEHQIKTFGRVLTQEELDTSDAEYQEERIKKFEGMTPVEAAAVQMEEYREWEKNVKELYGEDYLNFEHGEDEYGD
jgi:hypothetical protein